MGNIITKSIKLKLVLSSLLISILITAMVGGVSYYYSKRALKDQLLNSLTSIAESREAAILGLLKFRLQHLEVLATNEVIQNLMKEWNKKEQGGSVNDVLLQERVKSFFETELVEFNSITSYFDYLFIGKNGKVYYSSDPSFIGRDFSTDKRFITGMKKSFLTDVKYDSNSKKYFREIVTPIFPHQASHEDLLGAIAGVIMTKVGTEILNDITTNREGLGETGEVYVVNKEGYMVTESRFIQDAILKQKVDSEAVRLFQSKKEIRAGSYRDYRNILVAGVSRGLKLSQAFPELGWVVLAEVDESEFLKPVRKLRNNIMIMSLLIFIITSLVVVHVSNAITTPIERLTQFAHDVADGNFNVNVLVKSDDEIGVLANAFNKMAYHLKNSFTSIDGLNEEIKVRKKIENALRESEEKFKSVINNVNIGISLISPDMKVLAVNSQMQKWFPNSGVVEGTICYRVFCNPSRQELCLDCPTHKTFQDGQIYESVKETKVGNKIMNFRVVSCPVKDKDGLIVASVEMFEDISERKKAEKALEEAIEMKAKFTAMVSHELRTPLGPIKEGVSIILDGLTGEINLDQKDLLTTVKRNAERLNRLINNVLDFQKLEAGRVQYDIKDNGMAEVINEVYNTMKLVTNNRGLEFSVEVEQNLPRINFDRDKITQVLINLVNNAVKFTEKGGIKIKAKKGGNNILVLVEDTGPGIAEKDIYKLFQTFSRLELTREKGIEGSGLGLAISKEIVLYHKGKIWVESELGRGSIFQFVLPIDERRS